MRGGGAERGGAAAATTGALLAAAACAALGVDTAATGDTRPGHSAGRAEHCHCSGTRRGPHVGQGQRAPPESNGQLNIEIFVYNMSIHDEHHKA